MTKRILTSYYEKGSYSFINLIKGPIASGKN